MLDLCDLDNSYWSPLSCLLQFTTLVHKVRRQNESKFLLTLL